MIQINESKVIILQGDDFLADIFEQLDRLHTAICEDQLYTLTPLARQEVEAWLNDIIFTAQETVSELHHKEVGERIIWLVDRPEFIRRRFS